jgi:predicted ATPase/two-component sensor histidine kinase
MIDLSLARLEVLRAEAGMELSRVWLPDGAVDGGAGTILMLRSMQVSGGDAAPARMRRHFEFSRYLSPEWAAMPLDLVRWNDSLVLLLSDAGNPLAASAGPLTLDKFLRVAIGAAGAVAAMHCAGIVHKDVRPANLLIDSEGVVRLTGFDIASTLPRETAGLMAPGLIQGTLAYMAPEQTGRMNRSIDARSDLYALGVSLHELATGQLPFSAATPIEWLHSHVARQPLPANEVNDAVPAPVAAIILKLLSKDAEDRYQTSAGLEADLRRCRQEFEATGTIGAFRLGGADASDRLLVPERLYGRTVQVAALVEAFASVDRTGASRVVLISGGSGTGKSSLVNELAAPLLVRRAILATGKFSQYRHDIPYATLGEAFRNVVQRILGQDPLERKLLGDVVRGALAGNGQLLIPLIPELEELIGEQPAVLDLPPQDSQRRYHLVIRRFIVALARPEQPLVLFIDDIQWLDSATLHLLEDLFTNEPPRHVLLILAFRDGDGGSQEALKDVIAAVRRSGMDIDELALGALELDDVANLVAGALRTEPARIQALAELIHEKTAGNPLFVVQFINTLRDEGLLSFSTAISQWSWDLAGIRLQGFTENVLDLMAGKLDRLDAEGQDALRVLACLGGPTPLSRLALALDWPEQQTAAELHEIGAAGLIQAKDTGYSFVHDRVMEAAYTRIPVEDRPARHLEIGRRLLAGLDPTELQDAIFDVANQLNLGAALLTDPVERRDIAMVNLTAGRRARRSTACTAALNYFRMGRQLLEQQENGGGDRLCFDLAFHAAESLFASGESEAAQVELSALAGRADNPVDRAAVSALQVTSWTAVDRIDRAVETSLEFLRHVGIDWSAHPGREAAWLEYRRLLELLDGRPIEGLIDLALLTDPEQAGLMDVLSAVLPPAFFSDQNFVCLVLCRMANLSLLHGNSDASPLAYAYLGMVLGPYFGEYELGFRFGVLGRDLVVQRGLRRYEPRVNMCFAYHVSPWTRHILASVPLLHDAFDMAVRDGDLTYSGFSACTLVTSLIAAGLPLADVQREAEAKLAFVKQARFGLIVDIITSQLSLIWRLRGSVPGAPTEEGPGLDEMAFERRLQSDRSLEIALCWHWIRKLQAAMLECDFAAAVRAAAQAEPLLWTTDGHFEVVEYTFHAALAHAGLHPGATAEDKVLHREAVQRHGAQLARWALNCAPNFEPRAAVVAAALAMIDGQIFEAMRLFEHAIRAAQEHRLVQIEAIAYEWAAKLYLLHDFATIAQLYFRNARDGYLRWGATAKVQHLELLYRVPVGAELSSAVMPPELRGDALDFADVVRTSQAVSDEPGLPRLIRTLMVIVLQHAGATRGLLILPRGGELQIEAEAKIGRNAIEVQLQVALARAGEVPHTLVESVMQSHESVLLEDARSPHPFDQDRYFADNACLSVLCVPLLKQAKVIGLLYLENNLAPRVFTPTRVAVLRLLASQAAIALASAALEEKEALLKEVHHRVKNNLQMISSLLNLQASRIADKSVASLFADSRDRVRSMAIVHENLYQAGNYTRVSMRSHLSQLCAQLERAWRPPDQAIRIDSALEDIQLGIDRAISCGLVVNELVSNAFKHAFPDGRSGRIVVTLATVDADRVCLTVRDDGVGFPPDVTVDPGKAATLGLQLVGDLVAQLQAAIEIRCEGGAEFIVTFGLQAGSSHSLAAAAV